MSTFITGEILSEGGISGSSVSATTITGGTFYGNGSNLIGVVSTTGFTGGTISGATIFTNGITANTISATTYQNLPVEVFVTGASYSNNTFTFTNTTGGTFVTSFNNVTGLTVNGVLTVTGNTNISGDTNVIGDVTGFSLVSSQSSGDEGGEVRLSTSQTNNSLSGGSITIDINQNKLRFFETGSPNRGAYIDISSATAGVGTNLIPSSVSTGIIVNNGGTLTGSTTFSYNFTTNELGLNGTDTEITINNVTNEPSAPSSGKLKVYSKSIAGRSLLKLKGPSNIDYPIQPSFWLNTIYLWTTTTATNGLWLNTAGAGAGTYLSVLPTDTNIYTSTKRSRYSNVVTTANQVLGQRNTDLIFYRGSAVSGAGGFFFFARCGFDTWSNGGRFFAGMATATTVISADPSALNNTVGFCVDAADNGAISFLTRGTAATKASTGFTIVSNKGYDLYIFCAPGSSQYDWRIVDINLGTESSGTATLNLPTINTKLTANVLASNASIVPVNSIQLGVSRIYIETDY